MDEMISHRVPENFRTLEERVRVPESDGYYTSRIIPDIRYGDVGPAERELRYSGSEAHTRKVWAFYAILCT